MVSYVGDGEGRSFLGGEHTGKADRWESVGFSENTRQRWCGPDQWKGESEDHDRSCTVHGGVNLHPIHVGAPLKTFAEVNDLV